MSLETLAATATESRGGWQLIKIENKYFLNVKYDNFLPINNNIESVGPDLSTFSGVMIYSRNRSIKYFVTKKFHLLAITATKVRPRQEQKIFLFEALH